MGNQTFLDLEDFNGFLPVLHGQLQNKMLFRLGLCFVVARIGWLQRPGRRPQVYVSCTRKKKSRRFRVVESACVGVG